MQKQITKDNMPHEPPLVGIMPGKDKPRIVLAQDIHYPPYATLDEEDLTLSGFAIELAQGIERMAPDEIEFVFSETKWANCWNSGQIGQGLANGWFHGCMSYTENRGQRQRSMDFTHGILDRNKAAGLLVRLDKDGNPEVPADTNLHGLKVADVNGWAPTSDTLKLLSNSCTGEKFSEFMMVIPETGNDAALKLLLDREVDAVYIYADQAAHYKKPCVEGTALPVADGGWDCKMWERFEKDFAYIQTGLYEFSRNGTTLSMHKKGSGLNEILNPLIDRFLRTEEYYKLCEKWDLTHSCYKNEFFPDNHKINYEETPYRLPTSHMVPSQSCSTGYCQCPNKA